MKNNSITAIAFLSLIIAPAHFITCGNTPSSGRKTKSVKTDSHEEKKLLAQKFIEACTTEKSKDLTTQQNTFTILRNNKEVACAQYTFDAPKKRTFISDFTIQPEYRNQGIGSAFFELTMVKIAKSGLPRVEWIAYPTSIPREMSLDEAADKLYRFYRAQGATVDEDSGNSSLDLVKAGYLK